MALKNLLRLKYSLKAIIEEKSFTVSFPPTAKNIPETILQITCINFYKRTTDLERNIVFSAITMPFESMPKPAVSLVRSRSKYGVLKERWEISKNL